MIWINKMRFMFYFKKAIACFIFLLCAGNVSAHTFFPATINEDSLIATSTEFLPDSTPILLPLDSVKTKRKENKKLIAAVLAFPFPFGVMGLHRIYLGTKPYMPFVYIGTVGGCFGILPLIDFITILTTKKDKIKNFENNRRVFMWSH